MSAYTVFAADAAVIALTVVTPFVVKFSMLLLNDVLSPFVLPADSTARKEEDRVPATWQNTDCNGIGVFLGIFAAVAFAVDNLVEMNSLRDVALMYLLAMVGPFMVLAGIWLLMWSIYWSNPLWKQIDRGYIALKRLLTER